MVRLFLVMFLMGFALVSLQRCGKGSLGQACSDSDGCQAGLQCLEQLYMKNNCTSVGDKFCTTTCATDADCSTLGAGVNCIEECPGNKLCFGGG